MDEKTQREKSERWFCHYFESAAKTYSRKGGHRIAREAKALKNNDGSRYFDYVLTYRKKNLGVKWVEKRKEHFKHARGAGYWVWKPRVIQLTLEKMKPGDTLLYADTGCEIRGSLEPLFKLLEKADIVPFELLAPHDEKRWTKGDVFDALNAHQLKDTLHRSGTFALFRKSPLSVDFVNKWMHFCSDLHLIDDSLSIAPNYPEFQGHLHDQSIWSLLTKLENIPAYPDIGWPPDKATMIAASRRTD